MTTDFLVLTVADHCAQEFYDLGRIAIESPAWAVLADLQNRADDACNHDAKHHDRCFIVDYWPDQATGISDDVEVSEATARQLMPDLDAQVDRAKIELAAIYEAME